MNVPSNLAKSCLLASASFWIIIGSKLGINDDMLLFALLSIIPIFIIVTIVILGSICPFFWINTSEEFNRTRIFKTYFPYYAIVAFGIYIYGITASDFELYIIAFFSSAFITTSQSWVWFTKETTNEKRT